MTRVVEPMFTRDHTERALEAFGAQVERAGTAVADARRPAADRRHLPRARRHFVGRVLDGRRGGPPGSEVTIEHVGLNPSRTGIIDVLERMGARDQDR